MKLRLAINRSDTLCLDCDELRVLSHEIYYRAPKILYTFFSRIRGKMELKDLF